MGFSGKTFPELRSTGLGRCWMWEVNEMKSWMVTGVLLWAIRHPGCDWTRWGSRKFGKARRGADDNI